VLSLFIIGHMGLFFYTKISSIISIGDLPTTNIIESNFIKERKAGFFGDKTDSSTMIKNEVRMMMGCLAYNLYLFLKQLAGDEVKALTIKRFRRLFLHIAGKYVSTARRHILKFSSLYAYSKQFQALFDTICQINLILPVPYRARGQGKTCLTE
ncbi:transposase, partial [Streptococcus pneumoniae]|uniref:transposase n=1 Tax=Streptococcus pneumoniae TaxID=1313 RepID=UPI000B0DBE4B